MIISKDDSEDELENLNEQTAGIVQKCYDAATQGATHFSEALTFRQQPHIAYYDARK